MPKSEGEDRSRLDGFESDIFKLVRAKATSKEWKEWLRAPLEHAAVTGNADLFTRLMDAGADGSAGWRGCRGRTLLYAAAVGNSEKIVFALLKAGAKPDIDVVSDADYATARGATGVSALYMAARWGAKAAAKALLIAGADPNLPDSAGFSPLHVAARSGYLGLVDYLLVAGADPNAKTYRRRCRLGILSTIGADSPLHFAACNDHVSCVSALLLGGAIVDPKTVSGATPLSLAVKGRCPRAVKELLAAGARVDLHQRYDEVDILGNPSNVGRAAYWGDVGIVKMLLQHGSDSCGRDSTGDFNATPLHFAAAFEGPGDNGETVCALLRAGALPEAVLTATADESTAHVEKLTPLHVAARRQVASCGTIRALLEGGANVHALDAFEQTPLHMACSRSHADAVELLLRWGACERLTSGENGETAADLVGNCTDDREYDTVEEEEARDEQRIVDNARILHMLASAPADRRWRRRGWLVLARSRPNRVQLTSDGGAGNKAETEIRSEQQVSAKVMRMESWPEWGNGGTSCEKKGAEEVMADLVRLVNRLVGVEAECVFRMIVGFL